MKNRQQALKPMVSRWLSQAGWLRNRLGRLVGDWRLVAVLLVAHYALAVGSLTGKCTTYDEIHHVTEGCSYWLRNDYRLSFSINTNLTQRLMALPVLAGGHRFPTTDSPAWRRSDCGALAHQFFYEMGNDADAILLQGRAVMGLLSVALGLMVYLWSRRLFGPGGGLISLLLYVFDPTVLANAALMHNDTAGALFFLASLWALWTMLHKVTPVTVSLSALAMGALFLSKMSSPVIVPIAMLLAGVRLLKKQPLPVALWRRYEVTGRCKQAMVFVGATLAHAVVITAMIWASFGFRYSAMANPTAADSPAFVWEDLIARSCPHDSPIKACLTFVQSHQLLPEAYLIAATRLLSHRRGLMFLNGEYGFYGWYSFFLYSFLYKTPLTTMAILLLAGGAVAVRLRSMARDSFRGACTFALRGAYPTAPLWVFLTVYWAGAVLWRFNVGHRHILPVYPAAFILAGAAAYWFRRRVKPVMVLLLAGLLLLAGESLYRWPNYLQYFNQLIGGPRNGWKHFVDSNIDWGQELPSLKKYLHKHGLDAPGAQKVYLLYGGKGSPQYYGIKAETDLCHLTGGVYCAQAGQIQPIFNKKYGYWSRHHEMLYQEILSRTKALGDVGAFGRTAAESEGYRVITSLLDSLRIERLCAYLRQREPDDYVNDAMLIYRLSDLQVWEATAGKSPQERNDYDDLAKLRPDDAMVFNHLGAQYSAIGMFEVGTFYLDKAIQLDPKYGESYFFRAVTQAMLNHAKQAREDWQKGMELAGAAPPGSRQTVEDILNSFRQ